MKRKRGKKGKSKKLPVPVVSAKETVENVVNLSAEDNSGPEDMEKDEIDARMDAETPSSSGTDQPEKLVNVSSGGQVDGQVDKAAGKLVYNRVKVKIKSSKALESQLTSSDARTHSDTDKSSPHVGLDKQVVVSDKVEDSANSVPEVSKGVSVYQSKKAGSIKIKSRGFSSASLSPCNNAGSAQVERTHQKEPELPRRDSQYNKQELNSALEVIKKIMKMDAAEPFNVPVNPVALGIPDYFDVIDTPMDFGTICSNLENVIKYKNSEDVFNDVRYIWENCYKYNNKGDYILELMKRVKKNFSKYWSAAGLYSEQPQSTSGGESTQAKDGTPSNNGKIPVKGGHLKQKMRKRHGVKRHKDDCLCAICVMMRRRQEREENAQTVDDMETSDSHLAQEAKLEGTSPVRSLEGTSSSMDNSQDQDVDADLEDKGEEVKLEGSKQPYSNSQDKQMEQMENEMPLNTKEEGEISEHSQLGGRSGEEHSQDYEAQMVESGDDDIQNNANKEISMRHGDEIAAVEHHKPKEGLNKNEKAKIYEELHGRFENPMLLELCGTLFSRNPKSFWAGAHSLNQHQASSRSSSIHSAIATFMK